MSWSRLVQLLAALVVIASTRQPGAPLPMVQSNDNRTPAGNQIGDTLRLRLVVQLATWHAEGDNGPALDVAAFGEDGKAPQIPAPLIRVRTGTTIIAAVRNALTDSTIAIRGLVTHPDAKDSIVLRPGDSATVRFAAGAPGTYLYGATIGVVADADERETAGGAFVVDPNGVVPADRIFVMNIWGHQVDSSFYSNALAINGRSWPYDQQVRANVGDTVRWRVVNATQRPHPMHLHGFYYKVLSRGTSARDTLYTPAHRRTVVTETMDPFTTMAMSYVPNRPGNWLFHCHIAFHVTPDAARINPVAAGGHDAMMSDSRMHMAGLVLGIQVAAPASWHAEARTSPRDLRLLVQEKKHADSSAPRSLAFVLQHGAKPPAKDSVETISSPLILTRGVPTNITVVNRLGEASAVHWHGIELESRSDGVAGWSGNGTITAPSIQPGDSFVAHLTLPRAGTFIYHTHLNDLDQLTAGLYGAIVVLEPGRRFDPTVDHVMVIGVTGNDLAVNGEKESPPLQVDADRMHRLRFINILPAGQFEIKVQRHSAPVTWRPLAKDGADLPPAQTVPVPSGQLIDVGETRDFGWRPEAPGTYLLTIGLGKQLLYKRWIVVSTGHPTSLSGRAP